MAGRCSFNSSLPRPLKRNLLMGKVSKHIDYSIVKEIFLNVHKFHKDAKRRLAKSKVRDNETGE